MVSLNACMDKSEETLELGKDINDLSTTEKNQGLLKTGDIAYRDKNGFYFIVGRKNRYCKIYGVRINLSDLELLLFERGVDSIMKEGAENQIFVYTKNTLKILIIFVEILSRNRLNRMYKKGPSDYP